MVCDWLRNISISSTPSSLQATRRLSILYSTGYPVLSHFPGRGNMGCCLPSILTLYSLNYKIRNILLFGLKMAQCNILIPSQIGTDCTEAVSSSFFEKICFRMCSVSSIFDLLKWFHVQGIAKPNVLDSCQISSCCQEGNLAKTKTNLIFHIIIILLLFYFN